MLSVVLEKGQLLNEKLEIIADKLELLAAEFRKSIEDSSFKDEIFQANNSEVAGVYEIVCGETGEKYVGSTCNLKNRMAVHFSKLKLSQHPNFRMQELYDRYGKGAFSWSLLEEIEDREERFDVEQRYIDSGAYTINHLPSSRGGRIQPHTEATKKKMAEAKLGENHPMFKGYYVVPWGTFTSPVHAAAENPGAYISSASIATYCKNPDTVISRQSYGCSHYLRTDNDEAAIGMTWGEIGFGFEPIKGQ